MKNIKFLFLALATLAAGAFTACQEDWNPGPVDSELSVYLPTDVDIAAFPTKNNEETGDDVRVAKYPVYRQNPGPEMTVEFRTRHLLNYRWTLTQEDESKVELSQDEAFVVADAVTFAEGETVAYLTITMDELLVGKLSVGEMFDLEIMVKDAKYHGNYGLYRKTIKFGIPESWGSANINYDPESDEEYSNEGYFVEDFFTWAYSSPAGNMAPVIIEQSESRPGYYRLLNVFSEENIVTYLGGIPGDLTVASGDTYIEIDARDPEKVFIPFRSAGFSIDGVGDIYIGHDGESFGTLKDGRITFPKGGVIMALSDGNGWRSNSSGLFEIILPGVDIADYNLGVAYAGSETATDNTATNAIINFSVGADVSKFRFIAVEGKQDVSEEVESGSFDKVEVTVVYHEAIEKLIGFDFANDEPAEDDTMAEAKPEETRWFVSFEEAGVYTIFAVPYDKDGKPVMDEIASTYFYYRPISSDGNVPELVEPKGVLTSWIGAGGSEDSSPYYDPSYVLALGLKSDDAAYVSAMAGYFCKKSELDTLLEQGETLETLFSSNDEDVAKNIVDPRVSSLWVEDLQKGGLVQEFTNLETDTEYSVVVAMSSIYGKIYYYRYDGKTEKYDAKVNIGVYKFVDGDNEMQIEIKPMWEHTTYGQMYLLTFVGDTITLDGEDEEPFDLQFYAYYATKYNALVAYGDAVGYSANLFGVGLDEYVDGTEQEGDPEKYWGYYNSSKDFEEYDALAIKNESVVLYYDANGVINKLGTYFKKFYYYNEKVVTGQDDNGDDIVKEEYHEKFLAEFSPKSVVTLVESYMPAPEVDEPATDDPTTDEEQTENETNKTAKRASVGVYKGNVELKANFDMARPANVTVSHK